MANRVLAWLLLLVGGMSQWALADHHAVYKPNRRLADTGLVSLQQEAYQYLPEAYRTAIDLRCSSNTAGNTLRHASFGVWFKQVYCWGSYIKLSVRPDASVYAVQVHYPNLDSLNRTYDETYQQTLSCDTVRLFQVLRVNRNQAPIYPVWYPPIGFCFALDTWNKTSDYTLFFDRNGHRLDSISHARYFGIDTFVHGRVFNPDPLSSQGFFYGNGYIDNQDNDAAWFAPAYYTVKVPARFNAITQVFELKNNWVSLEEFEAPLIPPVQQINQSFLFNRSESGFEDVMVMHHIMQCRKRLNELGYNQLMNLPVHVDAHAQFGSDNSVFVRNGGDPALRFGTGGVDDAEDADVILHEYAHGLSWSANGNANFSFERSALDEGLADYWATSYSRRIHSFRWDDVFTWDGHNEFWNGRTASSTQLYPSNGNLYQVGEIWNAVLSKLWSDIGGDIVDRLQLESMFFYTEQTTLPEAARFLIEADTLLYNGIHTPIICQRFQQQGILNANCLPTSIEAIANNKAMPALLNTYGLALNGESPAILFPNQEAGHYTWWSADGRKLLSFPFEHCTKIILALPQHHSGFLCLEIETRTGNYRFPLWKGK